MPTHSNPAITKHIESSSDLIKKMDALTAQLLQNVKDNFNSNFGIPLPTTLESFVRVVQYDMVYATDPILEEYTEGTQKVLQNVFDADWPQVASSSLSVVTNVVQGIIGSGSIQTGTHANSIQLPQKNKNNPLEEKTFVTACLAIVEEAAAKDWATAEDFYVSYYAFVVWVPKEEHLTLITTNS